MPSNRPSEATQILPLDEAPAADLSERMKQLAAELPPRAQEVPANNGNQGGQPTGAEVLEPPATSLATHSRLRHPAEQRYIIRQTAIKCATDLVVSRQVKLEELFRYAGRIVAWIYSTPKDPQGVAEGG